MTGGGEIITEIIFSSCGRPGVDRMLPVRTRTVTRRAEPKD